MLSYLQKRNVDPSLLLGVLALLTIAMLIWLPFGFQMVGTVEEWRVVADFDNTLQFDERYNRLRPLQTLPILAAYLFQPDSFVALNVILLLAFFLKGLGLFLLLRIIWPDQHGMVLLAAFLFAVFPADEGLFTLRVVMHHAAVALLSLSGYFMLAYVKHGRRYHQLLYLICMVGSVFIYEAGYPLALLMLVLPRAVPASALRRREIVRSGLVALAGCVIVVLLIILASPPSQEALYQAEIMQFNIINPSIIVSMAASVGRMYAEHYALGWIEAVTQLGLRPHLTRLALLMSLGGGAAIWWSSAADPAELRQDVHRPTLRIIAICLVFMLAGYVVFVPSTIRYEYFRVYLYSSGAAALAVSVLLFHLTRRANQRRLLFSGIAALLLLLAFTRALNQQAHFHANSDFVSDTLAQIVTQAPALTTPVSMAFLDTPPARDLHIDMFYHHQSATHALRYIYHGPAETDVIHTEFCVDDPVYRSKDCVFTADGLQVTMTNYEVILPYEELLLYRYGETGYVLLEQLPDDAPPAAQERYHPQALIDHSAPLPPRLGTLFGVTAP